MDKKELIKIIGFITVLAAIYYFIKEVAKRADTNLYNKEGLREIQNDSRFEELEKRRAKKQAVQTA